MRRLIAMMALALSSMAVAGSPAAAGEGGTIAYTIYFYDASDNLVGVAHPRCFKGTVTYILSGTTGVRSEEVESYICGPNGPEPF